MLRAVRLEGSAVVAGGREACSPGATLWLDCTPDPENLAFLAERFGFHPLALEDCAHQGQRPKFEEYPESLFVVLHRLSPEPDDCGVRAAELHAFLGPDFLVTVHAPPIPELDAAFDRCARDPRPLASGPDRALWLVADALTDVHFAIVDALADDIDELLQGATAAPRDDPDLLERILAARRAHASVRRRLAPQREVFAALVRQPPDRVRPENVAYFRDVLDHVLRLVEEVDTGRDLLSSATDVHFSAANQRLAATTTRLTLAATIFLPLNFIAGFFGMNLEILPPVVAIPLVLTAVATIPLALWWWFRRRGLL